MIEKIIKNRISTTEIADCLGKRGALKGLYPVNRGHFCVGKVFLAYAYDESNWEVHKQIENVEEGDILFVETHNCQDRAIFGELVSKYLILYKRVRAIIINGQARDAHRLIKENFPIWCSGVTPIGCFNKKNDRKLESSVINDWKKKYKDTIAVCDDGGVVIIPRQNINKNFLEQLDFIELQEDIWHHCVDTKKWSTYDTVCLKKYLDTNLLPKELKDKFEEFVNKMNKGNRKF